MLYENTYLTQVEVGGKLFAGQNIIAKSWSEAELYLSKNGLGYLTIIGKVYISFLNYEFN